MRISDWSSDVCSSDLNFAIVQVAPGGPVEQVLGRLQGRAVEGTAQSSGYSGSEAGGSQAVRQGGEAAGGTYRGAQGLDPAFIKELERQFGFDKPAHERFLLMMKNYLTLDFGRSFFRDREVVDLIVDKMPVSISLGVWSTLIVYLISIPLGIVKAVRDGSRFDVWTRSEEHTSELQSLMRISYAVFCLKKNKTNFGTTVTNTRIVHYILHKQQTQAQIHINIT